MKKRQLIILGVTLLVLGGSIGLSSFFASQKKEPEERKIPEVKKYVSTRPVRFEDIQTNVVAYGRVQSGQTLELLSEVAGRMYEGSIRLKEGVSFRKGDLLFRIDNRESLYDLKSLKSNFLRDLAAILPDLKIDFKESFGTWETFFNTIDIDDTFPELPEVGSEKERIFISTRGIFSSYYSIKSAEIRLQKYRYYAPWDGSITQINFETGAFINPGTVIGTVIRSGVYELKVAVETRDIPWIRKGFPARIYSDETQQEWEGEVIRISDFVNQNTQSVDVIVGIAPSAQKIYAGQFFRASIPARIVNNGMVMPRSAIFNGSEVFVLQDSFLQVRQIDIYRLNEETAVFGGLEEGSELVVEPLINAHNNMKAFKRNEGEINMEKKEKDEPSITNSGE